MCKPLILLFPASGRAHACVTGSSPVPLGRICFPIDHDRNKLNNREQSETNRNDEILCVIIYPNIYECVSDYTKIHHDRLCTFYGHYANEARKMRINDQNENSFEKYANRSKYYNGLYQILFNRNDNRVDGFQIVRDCSLLSLS